MRLTEGQKSRRRLAEGRGRRGGGWESIDAGRKADQSERRWRRREVKSGPGSDVDDGGGDAQAGASFFTWDFLNFVGKLSSRVHQNGTGCLGGPACQSAVNRTRPFWSTGVR